MCLFASDIVTTENSVLGKRWNLMALLVPCFSLTVLAPQGKVLQLHTLWAELIPLLFFGCSSFWRSFSAFLACFGKCLKNVSFSLCSMASMALCFCFGVPTFAVGCIVCRVSSGVAFWECASIFLIPAMLLCVLGLLPASAMSRFSHKKLSASRGFCFCLLIGSAPRGEV